MNDWNGIFQRFGLWGLGGRRFFVNFLDLVPGSCPWKGWSVFLILSPWSLDNTRSRFSRAGPWCDAKGGNVKDA